MPHNYFRFFLACCTTDITIAVLKVWYRTSVGSLLVECCIQAVRQFYDMLYIDVIHILLGK